MEVFDDQTSWKTQAQNTVEECEEGISQTAVLLTDSTGAQRVRLERRMAVLVQERDIVRYRLDNDLPLFDWSANHALIFCLWMMTPVAAIISVIYASDIFAGEYARGTMRMILSRPVTRIKIYIAKLTTALLLGGLLLGVAYVAAGIGCGVLMTPSQGVYVGLANGSVYVTGWGNHVFAVFLCCCAMLAVVIALCAALGNTTRSRGVSAAVPSALALAGMWLGQLSGLIDSGVVGVLLPFCYDLTVPLCGVAWNSDCALLSCALSMLIHFVLLITVGYSGLKRDV